MLKKAFILAITLAFSILTAEETVLLGANDETGEAWQHVANRNHDVLVKFRNPFFGVKPLYIQSFEVFLEDTKPFQWAVVDTMDGMKDMESNPVRPYYNSLGHLNFDSLQLTSAGLYGEASPLTTNSFNLFELTNQQKAIPLNKQYFYFLFCAKANSVGSATEIKLRLDTDLLLGNNTYIYYHNGYNAAGEWYYQFQPISAEGDANGNILMKLKISDLPAGITETQEPAQAGIRLENYPNPFNNSTKIIFTADHDRQVKINLYDSKGALVDSVFSGLAKKGYNSISLDGSRLNSGVYFVSINQVMHKILMTK